MADPRDTSVPLWKHLATHALLASASVAYDWGSQGARPAHALLVFTLTTSLVMLTVSWERVRAISRNEEIFVSALSSVLYASYFFCLLTGISGTDASTATLILSLSICTNGVAALLSVRGIWDKNLILFTGCILIVVVLLKSRGDAKLATIDKYMFVVLGAIACELGNIYIRRFYCPRKSLDPSAIAQNGLIFSLFPAAIILSIDAIWSNESVKSLQTLVSYPLFNYMTWIYLGLVPNIVMLTWAIECEKGDAIKFHSLSGLKFIFTSCFMLAIPALRSKSLFHCVNLTVILLSLLLVSMLYLYNHLNRIISLLAEQPRSQGVTLQ